MVSYLNILKHTDIFYQLSPAQLEAIAARCAPRQYEPGQVIFLEGDDSDELYIIVEGEVDILFNPNLVGAAHDRPHQPVTIATQRRGESFGEIALVDRGLRSATARAAQYPVELLILPRTALLELCEQDPLLGYRLMCNLATDLALKIRVSGLRLREELLYAKRE